MESFSKDTEEYTEDIQGKKKSKLKTLKTRLFGRTKKVDGGRGTKLSQSASDITPEEGLGSEEDLVCSQGMLGSRALSHDSIFMADDVLPDPRLADAQSQENVHSNIKALQMKLQQQKLHLGPPPAIVPIKRPEDSGSRSEDGGHPHSPPEMSVGDVTTTGTSSKVTSQTTSCLLSSIPKATLIKSVPSHSMPLSAIPTGPPIRAAPAMDFSSPAQFTPSLDTSAARHRMSVKPRHQRASAKGKRLAATDSRPLNNTLHHSVSEKEEQQQLTAHDEITQSHSDPITQLHSGPAQTLGTEKEPINITASPQCPPSKSTEPLSTTPRPADTQAAPKSQPHRLAQQDHTVPGGAVTARVTTQLPGAKPHRPVDALASQQSRPSPVHPDKQEQSVGFGDVEETQASSNGPVPCPTDQLSTGLASMGASRSSSAQQQVQSQREVLSTAGVQRPVPASGSFRFSGIAAKGQGGERPKSGSFLGAVEQKGESTAVGTPWQGEEALCKGPILQDRKDNLKKGEPVMPSKQTAAVEKEEVEAREEDVENSPETKEDPEGEGKTAFGVKLRSTSLSLRFRSDVASTPSDSRVKRYSAEMGSLAPTIMPYNRPTKSVLSEQHYGNSKARENLGDNDSPASTKLSTNNPCAPGFFRQTDGTPTQSSFSTLPVKCIQTPTADPHMTPAVTSEAETIFPKPKEAETVLLAHQDPETVPQSAPEVSWMSMAMEKTRSFQQLLTSRLPRDFTSMQATSRPQTQAQPTSQAQTVTQSQAPRSSTSAQALVSSYTPSTTPAPIPALGRGEKNTVFWGKGEGASLSERRPDWAVSVGERAAFLQKQTEFRSPSGNKVELRKTQTESLPIPITTTSNKDPEGKPGVRLQESSPAKVPMRRADHEDKWLRKHIPSSSSPSSSPTQSSPLQSLSNSGQPSWMDLAKRKSMAWSDKSMD